jgi:hypothetical protein
MKELLKIALNSNFALTPLYTQSVLGEVKLNNICLYNLEGKQYHLGKIHSIGLNLIEDYYSKEVVYPRNIEVLNYYFDKMIFNFFGSEDSKDYDVMFFLNKLPNSIEKCHLLTEYFNWYLFENGYFDKPVNSNICVNENGIVKEVFKGSIDEVNNMLYFTYKNHKQIYSDKIDKLVERNKQDKINRTVRVLLTFISRTYLRDEVKKALYSEDLNLRISVLSKFDFSVLNENEIDTKVCHSDYWKVLAFQLGQTLLLLDGIEAYSKNEILSCYPLLFNHLKRKEISNIDKKYIEELKIKLIIKILNND